jgi:hypothetical protein
MINKNKFMKSIQMFLGFMVMFSCKLNKLQSVSGVYVNSNYNYEPFLAEVPYTNDTLILKKDKSFESKYFGKGSYVIIDNKIRLTYPYGFGVSTFEAKVEVNNQGLEKIILFEAQNHHYKRIK